MLHAGSNNESMGGWAYPHLWGCKYQWQKSRWTKRSKLCCGDGHVPTFRVVEPTLTTLCFQKPRGVTHSASQNLARSRPLQLSWIPPFSNFHFFFLLFSYLVVYAFSLMEVWFSWLSLNPLWPKRQLKEKLWTTWCLYTSVTDRAMHASVILQQSHTRNRGCIRYLLLLCDFL